MAELSGHTRSNLNDNEQKTLKRLRQRKDIVIKPADKGGAGVVWRKDLYQKKAEQQLSKNRLLFTMDIKGFYTNIPNSGLNALKYFLEKRNVQNPQHIPF